MRAGLSHSPLVLDPTRAAPERIMPDMFVRHATEGLARRQLSIVLTAALAHLGCEGPAVPPPESAAEEIESTPDPAAPAAAPAVASMVPPFAVGFERISRCSLNRTPRSRSEQSADCAGAIIPVAMWYPAVATSELSTGALSHYWQWQAGHAGDRFAARRFGNFAEIVFARAAQLGDLAWRTLDSETAVRRDALLREPPAHLRSRANPGASPLAGQFPVVLYHHGAGGIPEENFALAERIAAAGFVVLAETFDDPTAPTAWSGHSPSSLRALDELRAFAATLDHARADRVHAVGHSLGAQAVLAYAALGRPLVSVVSLDSTYENRSIADRESPMATYVQEERRTSVIPTLIAAAAPARNREYAESMESAVVTEAAVTGLSHEGFTALGQLAAAVGHDPSEPHGYEELTTLVVDHLVASERGEPMPQRDWQHVVLTRTSPGSLRCHWPSLAAALRDGELPASPPCSTAERTDVQLERAVISLALDGTPLPTASVEFIDRHGGLWARMALTQHAAHGEDWCTAVTRSERLLLEYGPARERDVLIHHWLGELQLAATRWRALGRCEPATK